MNDRQRRFAELVVQGRPAGRAYEEAGYDARGEQADQSASRLMSRNAKVKEYMKELRGKAAETAEVTAAELFKFHADVLRTPIGEIGPEHPLAQEVRTSGDGVTVKMSAKMDAAKELAKLMDLYSPERIEVSSVEKFFETVKAPGGLHNETS